MTSSTNSAGSDQVGTRRATIDLQDTDELKFKRFRRRGRKDRLSDQVANSRASISGRASTDVRQQRKSKLPVVSQSAQAQRWAALRTVSVAAGDTFDGNTPLVCLDRNDPTSRAFDHLRTNVLQTLRYNGWSRIAIAAPTSGCGSTFTAVNLSLSFSRIPGSRILLMDTNLRAPAVSSAFGVNNASDMRSYLSGGIETARFLQRASDTLALGLSGTCDQDTSELLLHETTADVLNVMKTDYCPDVTIYDMPAILAHDDLAAFLPQVDGVLLVSDGTKTTAAQIKACQNALVDKTNVLGVVLNQARTKTAQTYS